MRKITPTVTFKTFLSGPFTPSITTIFKSSTLN